jgi:hypothetical protein
MAGKPSIYAGKRLFAQIVYPILGLNLILSAKSQKHPELVWLKCARHISGGQILPHSNNFDDGTLLRRGFRHI